MAYENDEDSKVRVMSDADHYNYTGETIDSGDFSQTRSSQSGYRPTGRNSGMRSSGWRRLWDVFIGSNGNWVMRLALIIGGIAIVSFLFFVALPIMVTLIGIGLVAWFFLHMLFN